MLELRMVLRELILTPIKDEKNIHNDYSNTALVWL